MKEKTYRKETFATLEDFVNEAKRLVKDKNNFKFINREKYGSNTFSKKKQDTFLKLLLET